MAEEDFGFEQRDPRLLERIATSQTLPVGGGGDGEADAGSAGAAGQRASLSCSTGSGGDASDDDLRRASAPAPAPAPRQRKPSRKKMSEEPAVREEDLPQRFQVKYLGSRDASGLWGIKYTRKPVDALVAAAKALRQGTVLPLVCVTVSAQGLTVSAGSKTDSVLKAFSVDSISYGVQDLVYTRVFSMIVVRDSQTQHPFECHAFVCDSQWGARRITYALAAAFQAYSRTAGGQGKSVQKRFAIDLRVPEQIVEVEQELPDSEA